MTLRAQKKRFFHLALCGGQEILDAQTETTMGIRFPMEPHEGSTFVRYEHKLYDGAAGVGIALLDLYRATGDFRYANMSEEIAHGLIESTPEFGALPEGLYSGFGGVALFHLARAHILQKKDALEWAIKLGIRVGQSAYVDTDLMAGAAGRGLLQLALYYSTGESIFLENAIQSASFLDSCATKMVDGAAWYARDPRHPLTGKEHPAYVEIATQIHSGLAHGVAGIAFFLSELAATVTDRNVTALRDQSFRWLDLNAIRMGEGLVWTRSLTERSIQDHWCHGSAGIAHAYLAHYRNTGEQSAWNSAEAAASSTWNAANRNSKESSCHCHGLAGAIEIFLELHRYRSDDVWLKRALTLANRIIKREPVSSRIVPRKLGGKGAGLSVGTAGVLRQMLRLTGFSNFPILIPIREKPAFQNSSISKRASKRARSNASNSRADLVPILAVRFEDCDRFVATPPARKTTARSIVKMIADSPCGDAYFSSLREVEKACGNFHRKYGGILSTKAISANSFGTLLREIAAMTLLTHSDPKIVRAAAKRMTSNTIRAMDRMFQRLRFDLNRSLKGEVAGRITNVSVRSSDPHRGGDRAIDLCFEDGLALLYKARSLLLDREIAGATIGEEPPTLAMLCRQWLFPCIANGLLPAHRLIAAGRWHGYAETIQSEPNETFAFPQMPEHADPPRVVRLKKGDDNRYWYSAGLLAGYAFSLGIQDLHSENIVSGRSNSTPEISMHAVDLELAFGKVTDLEDTHLINGPRWDGSPRPHTHCPLDFDPDPYCALFSEHWAIEKRNGNLAFIDRPFITARWQFPHLVQNSDGSFGYTKYVCSFLRGFADQWSMMQRQSSLIAKHLSQTLCSAPMRVLLKATRSQFPALLKRKTGGQPVIGLAINPAISVALPYNQSELRQLNNFDIPYFFRYLEKDSVEPGQIFCFENGQIRAVDEMGKIQPEFPFWSIVERQSDPNYFARAMVDIAWAVSPQGPFDFHDPELGVRLVRTPDDPRLLIIVLLGEHRNQRLVCRVASTGSTDWWLG